MEHIDAELHNPDEVEEEAQVADEDEEAHNDYLLERDRPRRDINPSQRLGYGYAISFSLASTHSWRWKPLFVSCRNG